MDDTQGVDKLEAGVIELPYPHKILWPNGRTRAHGWKAGVTRDHRQWAHAATLAWRGRDHRPIDGDIRVLITVYPKNRGPIPDRDNAQAACKAYLDGIADALGVNDRNFVPAVQLGERTQGGKIVVSLS